MGNLINEAEDEELTDKEFKELKKTEADHLAEKIKSYNYEEFRNA